MLGIQHLSEMSENGPETMPRRYTAQEREDALRSLDLYQGSIPIASLRTGIPERTLRDWRRRREASDPVDHHNPEEAPLSPEEKSSAVAIRELRDLRKLLMTHIFTLTTALSQDDDRVQHRSIAVSRLLDRVMKLDREIAQIDANGPLVIRVVRTNPDGTVHDVPSWRNPEWQASQTAREDDPEGQP